MARQVRISGLVRLAETIRRELSAPLAAERRDRLRHQVGENLRIVQEILRDSAADVRNLPPPSRRAYQFLAGVEWERAVMGQTSPAPATAPAMLAWRGLTGFIDRALDRLAMDLPAVELQQLSDAIVRNSRQIELTIQRGNVPPERMSPATRAQRGWLAFMSQPENIGAYVQARRMASRMVDAAALGSQHYPPPLTIHFRPVRGIYKLRATRRAPMLWLPTPMVAFDEQGFAALGQLIFDRGRDARRRVIDLMTADGFQTVRAELESLGGIVEQARGATHDLADSFDRINSDYFGGAMQRPRLTWNRTFTGRKFGHYDFVHDTVMVSRTLDSPKVPPFVVDFLVFHEVLHKFHGLHWVNGRGYAHTSEFQQSERKFARYEEAEAVLTKLAREVR
jgi:hypothetical protein